MPVATFIHNGDAIDHTPTTDVASGAVVVQGDLIGIAKQPIAANALGALAVTGVFDVPKPTDETIEPGDTVYWDQTNQRATGTAAGNKLMGKCVRNASEADPIVRVRLSQ